MTSHLCISVMFLDPLFHGKGDDESEWPPSPMRLFQALLAGTRTGCRGKEWSETKAEAFRWLGRREPPIIVAPVVRLAPQCTLFVPNNDSDKAFDRQERLTSKIAHPHLLLDGDTVHYLWPIEDNDGAEELSHAEVLCKEARHLLALGWGIDQVAGNGRILTDVQASELPGRRWRAWRGHRRGQQQWRVPTKDSLADLEKAHQSFLQRINRTHYRSPHKLSFDTAAYISATILPPRPYEIFELPDGVGFRQEDVIKVGAMFRSLVSRCAKEDTHEFPGGTETYVAGHTGKQEHTPLRFSYLPLPTIGHEHADGMIRRLLIAEPYGGDGAHARWAKNRLRNATLHDKDGNDRGVLLDPWRPSSNTMINRYVNESPVWRTVTPVILPGFDDGKHAKAEKLFLTAVQQAGMPIDAIAALTMRKAPFWPGSQHPRLYSRPKYLRGLASWHVHIRFREPVAGPLTIGAGRHCGLGIFAGAFYGYMKNE